ncbi:hypothetical protein P8C59_003361 [Phyllachora maydis]|uniref:Uncharacterized protein n=1 Tax=Phyllachora maydis TaxID=1825666 RepID=A0AAD9MCB7_9PEZI|nr:hypothetical protein P8C59_003361 [Phyllachora maydis]
MWLRNLLLAFSLSLAAPGTCSARQVYTLYYQLPTGSRFTSFSGELVAPALEKPGDYYLWPGLQDPANSGVYQNVLDGRKGAWYFATGYYKVGGLNGGLPWGEGIPAGFGDLLVFKNTLIGDVWNSTLVDMQTGATATNTWPLGATVFDQAFLTIELYSPVTWDFGTLTWRSVFLTTTGTDDTAWCDNGPQNLDGATIFTITGASSGQAPEGGATCFIQELNMTRPTTP